MSKIISVAALLLGFLFAPAIGRGAPFIRGDSNGDGGLDISDSVDILFYLFLGAPAAPGCEAAADVDGLGTVEITDAVYGLLYLFLDGDPPPAPFPRCDEDPEGLLPCESYDPAFCPPAPSGRLVSASECKSHQEGTDAAAGKECLEYSLSRTTLTLRHIDAAFTCGIHIEAEVNIGEGTIEIVESESGAPADCLCLYDVDFQVDNLEPGTYAIDVKGLHGGGLKFTVDLQVQPSGSYCEPRDRYPWDTGQPEGRLLAVSGCGGFGEGVFAAPPSEECMTYELVGTTLTLHHLNAAFNCCPQKIEATIKVAEGTIDIVESETGGMCMCLCLYDLDLEIQNLPAGVYAISVTGGAAGGLKFTVDLQAQPSGSYCELRDEYPWEPGQDQPEGKLLAVSDCGGFGAGGSVSAAEECMKYELAGTTLTLHHLNTAFNCCPKEIGATIRVADGAIDIVESEAEAGCRCECLYDLDLEIRNLPAGVYAISVTGGTAGGLKFTVDLQAQPSGSYCEPRDVYPWVP